MQLSELILGLEVEEIIGETNIEIEALSIDSSKVQKSHLFICLSGTNYDSHNYIIDVEKYGAKAVVVEKKADTKLTQIVVKNSRIAMSKLAANFYKNPSKHMKIIGVSGTNGKTTTTHLIKEILEKSNKRVGLIGTLGVYFGSTFFEPTLTTPDPILLHKILFDMYNYGIDYVVMEVSAHALDLHKLDDINFEVGVFTNLTQDHLDYFKTMENYKQAKLKFFTKERCKRIVSNSDDEVGREIARKNDTAITYGIENPSDIFAIDMVERINSTNFVINLFDEISDVDISLIGRFNVYNSLAALTTCGILGISCAQAVKAIGEAKIVSGRLEKCSYIGDVMTFIDYAHTPDGLFNCLTALKKLTKGRLICVFGCGGNRDSTKREIMGSISAQIADFTVITSDNPRFEEPMSIISEIEKGVLTKTNEFIIVQKREDAIFYALKMAKSGDVVLVAGKGAEKYQEILGIKHQFNDKDVINRFYFGEI